MSMVENEIYTKIDQWSNDFVPQADLTWYRKYLVRKWKRSPRSCATVQSYLKDFYSFVGKAIVDLDFDDIDAYIEHIDASGKTDGSKMSYVTSVHKYLKHVAYELNRRGAKIVDMFPPELEFSLGSVLEEIIDSDEDVLPIEIMTKILDAARANSMREYVFFLLLKYCGMRISELKSLKIKNLHLDDRYLVTAVVHGCRKTNKDGKHPAVYFYPQHVANQIRQYLLLIKPGEEWAFPSIDGKIKSESGFISNTRAIMRRYSDAVDFNILSHAFRRTINTLRKKKECPEEDRAFLLNQKVSMNAEHYVKMSIAEKRAIYDKWNPW